MFGHIYSRSAEAAQARKAEACQHVRRRHWSPPHLQGVDRMNRLQGVGKVNRRKSFDQTIKRLAETAIRESLDEIAKAVDEAFDGLVVHPGDEIGWLIEMVEPDENKSPCPRWWHPEHGWMWDANKALRFARAVDAADYIKSQRCLPGKPTEHSWIATEAAA